MRVQATTSLGVALLLAVAVGAIGCGGGDSSSKAETSSDPLAGYPKGPTREFIIPGGDNVVQESGREGSPEERREASAIVEAWLRARAAGRWAKACSYLNAHTLDYALRSASSIKARKFSSCPKALPVVTDYNSEPPRDNIKGGVASLRVGSNGSFAQYHGKEGKDWVLPLDREDGEWKVANLFPIDRLK